MKKVISISMVIAILFAFTACSSKEYVDIPVTDKDGQAVTDENGEAVTERVLKADTTVSSENKDSTSAAASDKGTSAGNHANNNKNHNESTSKGSNATSSKAGNKNTTTKKDTTAKQTTTKPTTTEKAKKRDVKVTVYIPYYSEMKAEEELETELTLYYRVKGEDKWKKFETKKDITLQCNKDGSQKTEEFKLKGMKGALEFKADFKDVEGIKNNTGETEGVNGDVCIINPTTGIENIVGSTGNGWI